MYVLYFEFLVISPFVFIHGDWKHCCIKMQALYGVWTQNEAVG